MSMRAPALLTAFFVTALVASAAESWQTIDLRAFTNFSAFENSKAEWLVPKGRQVFDGAPFQVDGFVQLGGRYARGGASDKANKSLAGIPVGFAFARLHLLTALDGSAPESNSVTRIRLEYEGGSNSVLELKFGDQVRKWDAALHKSERTLRDTNNAAVAWVGQSAEQASSDRYVRLYHAALDNPSPTAVVKSLILEAPQTNCWPVIAGITVASANAPRLTNTVNLPANPFPDTRKRNGELAVLEGVVRNVAGQPVSNAVVRVMAQRGLSTQYYQSSTLPAQTNISATTDGQGRFRFPPLPDNKLYHLLVFSPGLDAAMFNGADPKSEPVQIRLLEPRSVTNAYSIHVKVVDGEGKPVVGALAEREGVRYNGGTSWGGNQGFPDYAVADSDGEFQFGRSEPFSALQMTISQPGFAPHKCWVEVTNVVETIPLDVGATVRGRVVKNGQPLTNVVVGMTGVDRNSEVFAGHYTATTDAEGRFEFGSMPPRISWWLHGQMSSLKSHGAIRPRQILTAVAGETNEVEDLEVGPGLRLAGKLQTRHGEPLPSGAKLTLSTETGWDSQEATVDKDGNFEFTGVVSGLVNVYFNQSKWRLSSVNRSFDDWGNHELVGLLQQDKDDFLVVVEPGERVYGYGDRGGQLPTADQARSRPIYGAESTGPYPITLAGQVIDSSTGKPVKKFTIVPGRKPPVTTPMATPSKPLLQQLTGAFRKPVTPWNELPWWDSLRRDTFSNGVFSVDFMPLTSTPMFRIEADGYEAFISEPMATNTTNLVIRLSSGSGPTGIVLAPDGKPAPGATLWYAVAREQAGLTGRALSNYGAREGVKTNGADGRFSFSMRPEGRKLFVAHTNGWAEMDVEPNASNLKITLAAWAVVKGTLVASNGTPMAGIPLHLTRPYDWNAGDPILNIQGLCMTDAKGAFLFTNALPGRLDLIREIRMGTGGGYSHGPQTWFICQPGITNDLGKVTYDSPPPPPFAEKVKRVLGL